MGKRIDILDTVWSIFFDHTISHYLLKKEIRLFSIEFCEIIKYVYLFKKLDRTELLTLLLLFSIFLKWSNDNCIKDIM